MGDLQERVLEEVKRSWDFEIINCTKFSGGCKETALYKIQTAKGDFVIRAYPPTYNFQEKNKLWEIKFLQYLNTKNFPCFSYIPAKSGESIVRFKCGDDEVHLNFCNHFYALTHFLQDGYLTCITFVEGEHILEDEREDWQIEAVGKLVSELTTHSVNFKKMVFQEGHDHDFPESVVHPFAIPCYFEGYEEKIGRYPNISETRKKEISQKLNFLLDTFNQTNFNELDLPFHYDGTQKPFEPINGLSWGFIHQDIHDENLFFDRESKKISGLVDWEDVCVTYYIQELALALISWCPELNKWNLKYMKIILENYTKSKSLSKEEKMKLKDFILLSIMYYYGSHLSLFDSFEIDCQYIPITIDAFYEFVTMNDTVMAEVLSELP